MNNLYPIINQCRNHAAQHPSRRKRTDNQQNHHGIAYARYIIDDDPLHITPRNAILHHANGRTQRRGNQQTHLASATQSIAAEYTDCKKQQDDQH